MKRSSIVFCAAALFITLSFLFVPYLPATELSSKEIKKIENGLKKLKNQGRSIQREGYMELKNIGLVSVPYLSDALKDKDINRESRILVCDLLGELKAKDGVPNLIYTLKNESYSIRAAACRALGKIADASAVDPLLEMLNDEESDVKESAAYALVSFNDKRIPPASVKLLKDQNERVRIAAITLLDNKLDPITAEDIREAFKKDKTSKVRQLAARALGGLKDKEAVAILTEAITEDSDNFVREECAISLGKIGDAKAAPALIEALKDEYKDVQLRASYALENITGKKFGRNYNEWSKWNEG